jgi:hypothetical protein
LFKVVFLDRDCGHDEERASRVRIRRRRTVASDNSKPSA